MSAVAMIADELSCAYKIARACRPDRDVVTEFADFAAIFGKEVRACDLVGHVRLYEHVSAVVHDAVLQAINHHAVTHEVWRHINHGARTNMEVQGVAANRVRICSCFQGSVGVELGYGVDDLGSRAAQPEELDTIDDSPRLPMHDHDVTARHGTSGQPRGDLDIARQVGDRDPHPFGGEMIEGELLIEPDVSTAARDLQHTPQFVLHVEHVDARYEDGVTNPPAFRCCR